MLIDAPRSTNNCAQSKWPISQLRCSPEYPSTSASLMLPGLAARICLNLARSPARAARGSSPSTVSGFRLVLRENDKLRDGFGFEAGPLGPHPWLANAGLPYPPVALNPWLLEALPKPLPPPDDVLLLLRRPKEKERVGFFS